MTVHRALIAIAAAATAVALGAATLVTLTPDERRTRLPEAAAQPLEPLGPPSAATVGVTSVEVSPVAAPAEPEVVDEPEVVAEPVRPLRVRIPGIDVDATVIDLGVNNDGTLEVPADFGETGWFTGRAAPGDHGPSVVVGHVDSTAGPAVFFRLRDLEPGDRIAVDRSDGLVAWFRVREVILVDKDNFPTNEVYGSTDAPELRLITCGGSFDRSVRSYEGNVIVYADHLGNHPPPTDTT